MCQQCWDLRQKPAPAIICPTHMQVLFCEQQLDCQLALDDPSPGMPWGRARFQARQGCKVCTGDTASVMLVVGGCWLVASKLASTLASTHG